MLSGDARPLRAGKIPVALLTDLIAALPPATEEVRLGPRLGEDACAIDVSEGVLVAATDPITFTSADAGRLAVQVNANDVAVTGARPRWFLAVVLVPPGTDESVVLDLFADIRRALAGIDVQFVGGHTEATTAVTRAIVIGQMLGVAGPRGPLGTGGARPGDVLVQIGPAPVEGAAVLANSAGERLLGVDDEVREAAQAALDDPGISVVEPALLATRLGASALHDPTEGGLAGGLHELAGASNVRLRIDRGAVLWFAPGLALCRALGVDPWSTLASGALLATFPRSSAEAALAALTQAGHPAAAIGTAEAGNGVVDRQGAALPWPERDEVARLLETAG